MTIETLRKAKKDTIRTLMQYGKSHPVLKYPVFIMTVIFIFVYNLFLHTLIQVHVHEKLARVMAAVLSFAVFFTGMDLTVLAVQSAGEQEEIYTVTGFAALSEEVADQCVPVGTAVEELNLPEALEAYVMQNQEDTDDNADNAGDDGTEIEPGDGDQEGTVSGNEGDENEDGESGEGDSDEETGGDGADAGEGSGEGGADTGEGSGEGGAVTGEGSDEGGADTGEGSGEGGADAGEGSDEGGADAGEGSGESGAAGDIAACGTLTWQIHTADFVLPIFLSENIEEEVKVETLVNGEDEEETASNGDELADKDIDKEIMIQGVAWQSSPLYDSETEGIYIFTPILPNGYALAEGVGLPQITVTVEVEEQPLTAAGELLKKILKKYFEGIAEDGIYDAVLAMDEDTRLSLTADYEELLAAMTGEDEADERLQNIANQIGRGIADAAANMPIEAPVFFRMRAAAPASASIPLRRISGSGKAFVYHSFNEPKSFAAGKTYAFLNGVYGYEDAVSSLGSGAILKVTDQANGSDNYVKWGYGPDAKIKVYVDVITRGRDFDSCVIGGLYQVPDSGTPTEYRYFCRAGGARNCGPYYAYNYVKESLFYTDVSASLSDIEKQGSTDPKDYIVKVTFGGGRSMTLDSGSYTIQIPNPNSDEVNIIVSDSEGNSINTKFRMPLVVRYDGNGTGVSNVPDIQPAWKGESFTVSSMLPTRSGYSFRNWKEVQTGTAYSRGQRITSFGSESMLLKAQWKDIQKPEVGYTPTQVMTKATDAEVKAAVEAALTITDNEPVEECKVEITVPSNFTQTAGNKDVTVKVTDKAGNFTTKTCTVGVMSYVEFSKPQFTADTKNLSVILRNPGMDPVTESGFVWGIMNAPSLTTNNGRKATASPVVKADGTISVTADNLQKGVTYYARAYIIADGVPYYSDEIEIGIGLPAYGTFTIKNNNNNTFTVTRGGGSEGAQTVYYRTVNGSAVGGTHFTHQAGELTFAAGETSQTITVSEQGVNTAYSGKPATAYTNADRTYSVQIYRVTGGGTLGADTNAERTMGKSDGYTVSRTIYDEQVINGPQGDTFRGDYDEDNLGWTDGASYPSAKETVSIKDGLRRGEREYWIKTAQKLHYRLSCEIKEIEDGYQSVQITPGGEIDTKIYPYQGELKGSLSTAYYVALSDHGGGNKYTTYEKYRYPYTGPQTEYKTPPLKTAIATGRVEDTYVRFDITQEQMSVGYGGSGKNSDKWSTRYVKHHFWIIDEKEPRLVAVAPMAGGLYKVGDTFTVSLIFDEIVDRQNSGDLSGVKVNTSWGQASYVGGADTNVLYFSGTIAGNADQTLRVNGFTNADRIKDMCDNTSSTETSSGSGNTTATVDTAKPNLTVASQGIAGGTGTVKVVVNADQSKANSLRYAWSDSASAPATGWVDASASELSVAKGAQGLPLSIRKEPGSGASNGKWYLHAIATYSTTGATDYKSAYVDFGTANTPAAGSEKPSLLVSTDNSAWARQRAITVQRKGGGTLQYRKSGVSAWTDVAANAGSVTVTENGYYTFRLTAADNVLTQTIQVEKIDRVNPTASVGRLLDSALTQSPKEGIYTKIALPVTFADSGSGVKTVEYAWTNGSAAPAASVWTSLTASQIQTGKADLAYTATESVETAKYLHIKVTDHLDHTYTTKSSAAYKVISQNTVKNHTPKVTLTGAPTEWTNDMATLQWSLTDYEGKNYEVILPNGNAKGGANNGLIWARSNGTYTVKVRDLDYGGENTAAVEVKYIDTTAPTVTPSRMSDDWKKTAQTVTFSASDSQSGVGKKYYKIVDTKDEIPTDGLTQLTSDRVNVAEDGAWYVYYKYYDKAGDDSIGREANKTEGFIGPIRIDRVSPTAAVSMGGSKNEQSGWYTAAVPATLTFSDPQSAVSGSGMPSGVKTVEYLWMKADEKPTTKPTSGLQALTAGQTAAGEGVVSQQESGVWYLYYKVTDAAGNVTDGFSEEAVKIDTTKAALTVTGPAAAAEKKTGIVMTVQSGSYGPSGGALSVKKDGLHATETALKSSTGSGVLSADHTVTEPGTYHFYSRANADKSDGVTAGQTRYVHQVTFDSRGGSEVEPQLVWTSHADAGAGGTVECKVQRPADPTRRGLVFGGWYTDGKCKTAFDFNSQIYEDTTLYAKWTADFYEVTYHLTNPDGSAYEAADSDRMYAFGEGLTLPVPKQEGYRFEGWYLTAEHTGEVQKTIGENETGAKTYYARYVDIAAPKIVAELSAESEESGWYTAKPAIDLTYSDNQGVKRLLVSVDGEAWQELSGFPMGGGIKDDAAHAWAFTTVQPGDHTYAFQAVDAIGLSTETKPLRVKLDTVKPVMGELRFNEGYVNLWDWLIRKDSLIVNIPVTEEMSGLDRVTYTLTPGSMRNAEPVTKEAKIEKTTTDAGAQYTATIVIDPDYKGVIGDIQATDIAGNVSEPITAYANGIGVIVEELKPVITVTADRLPTEEQAGTKLEGEALSADYYQTAPELFVKVQDGSMAASGIKEVKWRIDSGSENAEDGRFGDALTTEYGFRIMLNGLTGRVRVEITVVDNAGNSGSQTVTVKIKGTEQTPEAQPDYPAEKLTGLKPGETYLVCLPGGKTVSHKADENGEICIDNSWFGKEISLIKKGDGKNTKNSNPQSIALAARPAAPVLEKSDETVKGKKDGQIKGVTDAMETSRDDKKTWEKAAGTVNDAAAGKLWARVAATQTAPCGQAAFVTVKEGRSLTVTFDSQGGSKVKPIKGLSWKEAVKKPAEPKKEGDNGFCGWYRETSYENKWHFAEESDADLLTNDVTLFAKWLPKTDTPMTVGISYRDEALTKLEPGKVYLIEGKEVAASAEGTVLIDESWFGKKISIVRRGDGISTGDSDALPLTVPKRPAGPVKVQPKAESAQDAKDGKLTKTDTTMQYRKKGSTEWITVTGEEITDLEPGDYELRYVSTDTAFSSKIVVKTVKRYSPPKKDDGDNGGKTPGDDTKPEDGTTPGEGTKSEDGTTPGDDTKPKDGTTPGEGTKPKDGTTPGEGTKPKDGTTPGEGTKPKDGTTPGDDTKPKDETKPADNTKPGDGIVPSDDTTPKIGTAPGHIVEDGSGSLTGEHLYAVGKIVKTLTIPVQQGAVIVTVNNMDGSLCTAQALDAVAVANAVLSREHVSRVSEGETVEIRIDVERIDDRVSSQDKDLIEQGIEKAQEEVPGLKVGMYVDISMFLRRGEEEWSAVHEINEPIEIMIDMPEDLREHTADFYIVRAHAGECTLLPDLDDAAETITIETERFSTYAIAYRLTEAKAERCGLCHICPTFLGICCFIWLILVAAVAFTLIVILLHKKRDNEDTDMM